MMMHAGFLLAMCIEDVDGTTGHEPIHGQQARLRMPQLGETMSFHVPRKNRHNLDATLKFNIFRGRSHASGENIVGLKDGSATRARGICKTTPEKRLQKDRLCGMLPTPIKENVHDLDRLEDEDRPRALPELPKDEKNDDVDTTNEIRRRRTTKTDIKKYGYTSHCPTRNLYRLNQT